MLYCWLARYASAEMISALLGGIGLFLLGMTLMTEGLRAAAGGALRDLLARFTGGPYQAFASGAAMTAMVQSSSATIVTTIGFVSAGLLTLSQAVGVIFGAAVGTTSTGWLVAFLGLRYSVSVLALPCVGVGALLRLLGRGRLASIGLIIAGFGLIFVGIDTLQAGMAALSDIFELGAIPGDALGGRLLLVLIGVVMTVVMQSSSAAVATTLAAVHTGTIEIAQAAALVVGQNVGTTVTAGLASIGASVPARRTALAHILLNSFSGLLALTLFPVFLALMARSGELWGFDAAEQIALFHTAFNLIGVGVLLPLMPRYTALLARLVVDRAPRLTRNLDASVQAVPAVAVEAARRTVIEIGTVVVEIAVTLLRSSRLDRWDRERIELARAGSVDTRAFLGHIRSSPEEGEYGRHLSILHAADHVERLIDALTDAPSSGWRGMDERLDEVAHRAAAALANPAAWFGGAPGDPPSPDLEALSQWIAEERRGHRPAVMAATAAGQIPPAAGLGILDAMRWVDRVVYHVWRATYHLGPGRAGEAAAQESFEDPPELAANGGSIEAATGGREGQ